MTTRGVHKPGAAMVTSRMLGVFRSGGSTRREFRAMIGRTGAEPPGNACPGAQGPKKWVWRQVKRRVLSA